MDTQDEQQDDDHALHLTSHPRTGWPPTQSPQRRTAPRKPLLHRELGYAEKYVWANTAGLNTIVCDLWFWNEIYITVQAMIYIHVIYIYIYTYIFVVLERNIDYGTGNDTYTGNIYIKIYIYVCVSVLCVFAVNDQIETHSLVTMKWFWTISNQWTRQQFGSVWGSLLLMT